MTADLARAQWRKSSRSGAGNDCVELLVHTTGTAIRDSKNADHGNLVLATGPWRGFLSAVKDDLLGH